MILLAITTILSVIPYLYLWKFLNELLVVKSIENTNKIVVVENDKIESAGEYKYLLKNSTRYRTLVQYPQLTSEDEY
ncbi:hypothetical protein [Mogibacterium sp. CM50]|uniref:hypothetical protein n=1 Tax=Mogibacterium sp. CM50 TaxID=936375 RepID=UPI0005866772